MDNTDKKTKSQKTAKKSIKEKPSIKDNKEIEKTKEKKSTIKSNQSKSTTNSGKKENRYSTKTLMERHRIFAEEYVKTANARQSALKAGYKERSVDAQASALLKNPKVAQEINRLREKREKKAIMDAQEVMELFSAIARGEVKDQFGLDATLADRLKAMNEIAKRTVDIDNRMKGIPDGNVVIKVDWRKS
jgi:phage terminase small subunit